VPAAQADVGDHLTSRANWPIGRKRPRPAYRGVRGGTVAGLTAADDGRAWRQLGVVGVNGAGATFTGDECHAWAGGVAGDGFAIQGNILTGPEVLVEMEAAWHRSADEPALARRLLAALRAGDTAGGDRRGRQSAALLVVAKGMGYGGTSDVVVDLRVDDHPVPMAELARLLDLHALYFDKADPAQLRGLEDDLATEVRQRLAALGHPDDGTPAGLDAALADWAGIENLEERIVAGRIDPLVLAYLRGTQWERMRAMIRDSKGVTTSATAARLINTPAVLRRPRVLA
jgi:uncharacterized Ntn-hydrolase superfamily protein